MNDIKVKVQGGLQATAYNTLTVPKLMPMLPTCSGHVGKDAENQLPRIKTSRVSPYHCQSGPQLPRPLHFTDLCQIAQAASASDANVQHLLSFLQVLVRAHAKSLVSKPAGIDGAL